MTLLVSEDSRRVEVLARLAANQSEVTSAVVASSDGHCMASFGLPEGTDAAAAAMSAAAIALGQRLLGLAPSPTIREFVLRGSTGDVALYRLSDGSTLAVFTTPGSNIALLHYHVRELVADLAAEAGP